MNDATIPLLALAPVRWNALPPPSRRALIQFATTRSVFVLEPPERIETGEREFWELNCGARDLLVCRPRVASVRAFEKPEEQVRMTRSLLRWLDIDAFVALLYTPAEEVVARALAPSLVIHDRGCEPAPHDGAENQDGDARRYGRDLRHRLEGDVVGARAGV